MNSATFVFDLSDTAPSNELALYCPGARGLPIEYVTSLSLLPIHDWNSELLQGASASPSAPSLSVSACVLAIDPFRRMRDVLTELQQSGFQRVTNFPSPSAIEGEMRMTLEQLGFGIERELQFIREAAGLGLSVAAFATHVEYGTRMVESGAAVLITTEAAASQLKILEVEAPVHIISQTGWYDQGRA